MSVSGDESIRAARQAAIVVMTAHDHDTHNSLIIYNRYHIPTFPTQFMLNYYEYAFYFRGVFFFEITHVTLMSNYTNVSN